MKIKHYIKEVNPNIFAVVIKNKYDRAMLFCRAQEYYESPSPKFRGKQFSIWDYMKWYDEQNGWGFSYGADWSGFNIPIKVIRECYNGLNKYETPYDKIMGDIIHKIEICREGYVIGCGDTKGDTFKHEVCHGFYYTNKEYKKKMDALTKGLPNRIYNTFKKNILEMGYTTKVVDDEIQAYLQYGYENPDFGRGVDIDVRIEYSNLYKEQAKL
jgi:hypothetical protein